jgi:signal transduction histidine kinase
MGLEYVSETCNEASGLDPQVIRAMRDAVSRADTIIRGLVDFSADRQLDVTAGDLNAMIRQSLLLVKHELTGAHVALRDELAPDLPPARLDATKIQQVFVNVLMNAIHAMEQGGTLTVRTYVEPDLIVAEVDDTGPGIPRDKLSKVWDPFFTTKGTGRGTGLGLTVSRKIIDLHGGEISIANRTEGGARVTIKISPAGTGNGGGAERGGGDSAEAQEADSRRG